MRMLTVTVLLILASCRSHVDSAPAEKLESTLLGCEDYQAVMTPDGILYNNVWNKHAAKEGEGTQCLHGKQVEGAMLYGWSWRWPTDKCVVYGYPQIKLGKSPWDPASSMDERFPIRISSVRRLEVSYDVETTGDGDYNLATSLWLTREPVLGNTPQPDAIVAEVMIWTYASPGFFQPGGSKHGELQAGNTTWEVWVDGNWGDTSGIHANKWIYLAYHSRQPSLKAAFDVMGLLQYAVDAGLISSDFYIADVMTGNEVMGGSGATWVKSFGMDMN